MRLIQLLSIALVALSLPGSASAQQVERVAGTIVAIDGDVYTVAVGGEDGISPGTILQVYRRLPGPRGTASYRESAVWWEVGKLTAQALGDGIVLATWAGPPAAPLPSGLDESGAPSDSIHVGDRVRSTGAVGERNNQVRVSFARADLFGAGDAELGEGGRAFFAHWLRGLKSLEGPIEVVVHPRVREVGTASADLSREISRESDSPFGPSPGEPVVPVEGLYEGSPAPVLVPEAREVLVVDGGTSSKPDVWHYLDPVSLARRQGEQLSSALAAHLRIPSEMVLVRVVPRPVSAESLSSDTPGYDSSQDQIRILAAAIDWSKPVERRPAPKPKVEESEEDEEPRPPKRRRRRILEPPPEVS